MDQIQIRGATQVAGQSYSLLYGGHEAPSILISQSAQESHLQMAVIESAKEGQKRK